jgi:DNA (cytosine-5)-methyltransferase 1
MQVGSLFSGIGGFDLAARWMGWHTKWYSEIEPYACRIMRQQFPDSENLGDITTITNPPPVDILCGGFPCQDISVAGKGEGITGNRSGLWKHYARLIGEVRPKWVVIENSPMLRSRGLGVVLQDLLALRYDAEWHCITAASVGAPHQRDRTFIVAYPHGQQEHPVLRAGWGERSEASASEGTVDTDDASGSDGDARAPDVAHPISTVLEGHPGHGEDSGEQRRICSEQIRPVGPSRLRCGEHTEGRWSPEPTMGRVAHGVPHRVDRMRCLGNAVVPQVVLQIFRAINAAR